MPLSIGAHVLVLLWLLHSPRPVFVAPSSVLGGVGGSTVTHLYWPVSTAAGTEAATASPHDHPSTAKNALRYHKPKLDTLASNQVPATSAKSAESGESDLSAPGRSAGTPYGSLSEGASSGSDVRPALPGTTFEPAVDRGSLAGVMEGNCVVEITIDETGAVVAQSVVQSMGTAIDEAVLAAVARWHFRPATRDGAPIPSKQDVVYHFKPL